MKTPYKNKPIAEWNEITIKLIDDHPLDMEYLKKIILQSGEQILTSKIGPFQIGVDIFPSPQILGNFLHELIPLNLAKNNPTLGRREQQTSDKDLVYIPDDSFSIEIKTSSNKNKIFGNRSYAQKSTKAKKSKSGYYLAINFEKLSRENKETNKKPQILKMRFGGIDEEDGQGQKSETGQSANLSADVYKYKMIDL